MSTFVPNRRFKADFYFKPVSYGIINQGISEYLKNTDADLLFETNTYFTTIKEVFITKEDICKSILDRFFVDKKEGEELLLKIEENITAINEKIFCFVNKLASVYTYHATNTLSFKLFIPDSEKWTEKEQDRSHHVGRKKTLDVFSGFSQAIVDGVPCASIGTI